MNPGQSPYSLSPKAVQLRNACLGTLSRRSSQRPPTPHELTKIRNEMGLREAWHWWSTLDTPTEAVPAIRWPSKRPARRWPVRLVTLLATGAWLLCLPRVANP